MHTATPGVDLPDLSTLPMTRTVWRGIQWAVWLVGVAIFVALLVEPDLGLHAFWNVLIPVAPALLAFAPGLWRNICPLASTALFPRHMGYSRRRSMSAAWQARLLFLGVALLLLLVPLRHVVLDLNGPATALVLGVLTIIAVVMGTVFEWKSGWCSALCPVHPVERLYGQQALYVPPNAHCEACQRCVSPCPDSTPAIHPISGSRVWIRQMGGTVLVGGFAGYIIGWFFVPDWAGAEGWHHLGQAYAVPFLGLGISLFVFLALRMALPRRARHVLVLAFAAAAISAYYWFRLPMLFGFAPHPGDGMLVDLRGTLPRWFPAVSRATTTLLFFWWFLGRSTVHRSWSIRPHYAP